MFIQRKHQLTLPGLTISTCPTKLLWTLRTSSNLSCQKTETTQFVTITERSRERQDCRAKFPYNRYLNPVNLDIITSPYFSPRSWLSSKYIKVIKVTIVIKLPSVREGYTCSFCSSFCANQKHFDNTSTNIKKQMRTCWLMTCNARR